LSADAFTEQQKEAYAAGVSGYLTKPLDFQLLFPVLVKYLRQDHSQTEKLPKRALSPLPDSVKRQLKQEFVTLSQISIFRAGKLYDQFEKIRKLCDGYESPYPETLKEIEKAISQHDSEAFDRIMKQHS